MTQSASGDTPRNPIGDTSCFDSSNGYDNTGQPNQPQKTTSTKRKLIRPTAQIPKKRPLDQITSCVAYIRVSTPGQADTGHGLLAQRKDVETEAATRDWVLEHVYSDSGVSGTRSDRAGLAEALMHAKSKRIPLIVPSLSRIGRRMKIILNTIEDLEDSGCTIISCSERLDTSGAAGRVIVNVLSALAELERDTASERTKAALQVIRESGRKTGGQLAPFGWDVSEDGTLVENEREQEALNLMYTLKEEGYSLRQIGRDLSARSIKTKSGLSIWHAKVIRSCIHVATQIRKNRQV